MIRDPEDEKKLSASWSNPSKEMLAILAKALPTRSHPQGALDGKRDWREFAEQWVRFSATTEAGRIADRPIMPFTKSAKLAFLWVCEQVKEGEPPSIRVEEAGQWVQNIRSSFKSEDERALHLFPYLSWLMTKVDPGEFVDLAWGIFDWEASLNNFEGWYAHEVDMALRNVLPMTSAPYFDSALALFRARCQALPKDDLKRRARLAFILADDRPGEHELKPLAVIGALEASDVDRQSIGERVYLRLALDCPPSGVAWCRGQKIDQMKYLLSYLPPERIGAIAIAAARHYGESALPTLRWLMPELWRAFADLLIDMDEPGAFPLLVSRLWDKRFAAVLEKAARARPGEIFNKCLGALLSGQPDPRLAAQVEATITNTDPQLLRKWVGKDAKALGYIEHALQTLKVAAAAPQALPAVLRDPPWLQKRKDKAPTVLAITPMATPYAYVPFELSRDHDWEEAHRFWSRTLDYVIFYIRKFRKLQARTSQALERSVRFKIDQCISVPLKSQLELICKDQAQYDAFFEGMQAPQGALTFFLFKGFPYYPNDAELNEFLMDLVIERLGPNALPTLIKYLEIDLEHGWGYLLRFDAPEIAPLAAAAFLREKRVRDKAAAWLVKFRRTALVQLIAQAFGPMGPQRQAAEHALRWLADRKPGGRAAFDEVAAMYAAIEPSLAERIQQALDGDRLEIYPSRIPKLAVWLNPAVLARPELKSGGALPDGALMALLQMIAFSTRDAVYGGIDQVKQALTRESLAAFAWDLFSMWLAHGAPLKDSWAMWALAWLGDDECVARFTRLLLRWPNENASARAMLGLDVLEDIGNEAALVGLARIASKDKFKGLQQKARNKVAAMAQALGLTLEELSYRSVPELDLDERGGLDLDFGARRFRVGLDERLKPTVMDESGKRLDAFPRTKSTDNQNLASIALAKWKTLNADLKELGKTLNQRLERMLVSSRRLERDTFLQCFVRHRLMRNLTQRLVWGVYAGGDPLAPLEKTFRVCEDLSLAGIIEGAIDAPFDLDSALGEQARVGLAHPIEMKAPTLEAWRALFADYEIVQPIAQLSRETYALTEDERESSVIKRFEGCWVDPGRIYGAASQGWDLGHSEDGVIEYIEKEIHLGDDEGRVTLVFAKGVLSPAGQSDKRIALGELSLFARSGKDPEAPRKFGDLTAIEASEILRIPSLLAAKGEK